MKKYKEGQKLKEDEYMLKIRKHDNGNDVGFMTKYNKDGSMPVKFTKWNRDSEIFVIEEHPRNNWKFEGMRFGESQNWAILLHPLGFTIEVYAQSWHKDAFMDLMKRTTITNGVIKGFYHWEPHNLIEYGRL